MPLATVGDVAAVIDSIGLPVANVEWPKNDERETPYAVLVPHASLSRFADNGTWYVARRYDIELYVSERDVPIELRLAGKLREAGIPFTSDVYRDEENHISVTYFSTTLIEQEASDGI